MHTFGEKTAISKSLVRALFPFHAQPSPCANFYMLCNRALVLESNMADERKERSTKEVVTAVLDDFERLSR